MQGNTAESDWSIGKGGGLQFVSGTVSLDTATVAHVTGNTASSGAAYDNIDETYILL